MTATGAISELSYVALRTRDLTASVRNAADVYGLRSVENTRTKAYLAAADTHHELVYIASDHDAVDHFGLVAANEEELGAIEEKVRRAGHRILAGQPIEDQVERGFAFVGPEGFTWHIHLGVGKLDARSGGFGPDRFGHFNVQTTQPLVMRDFLIDVFDFRVSDQIGDDAGFFLRCNPDHHGIAIFKKREGPATMHHHGWQTQNIADLGRLADRLRKDGRRLLWGPVRHGAGHNIAAYAVEPSGGVIELYTDMEYVYDRDRPPIVWDATDPYWVNQWDGLVPADIFDYGMPPTPR